jgi:hypothetical protein
MKPDFHCVDEARKWKEISAETRSRLTSEAELQAYLDRTTEDFANSNPSIKALLQAEKRQGANVA